MLMNNLRATKPVDDFNGDRFAFGEPKQLAWNLSVVGDGANLLVGREFFACAETRSLPPQRKRRAGNRVGSWTGDAGNQFA